MIETWNDVLDGKGYGGAVLMDLPKAFATINYELAKLHAYELTNKLLRLIKSYITNCGQRKKANSSFSSWSELIVGVTQGSVLDSNYFSIFT